MAQDKNEYGPPSVNLQGTWWPFLVTEASLNAIKNFEVRDDDVWVATWPKAGTHWVAEICHLIHHNGELDKVDREQQPMPLEFETLPGQNKPPRYHLAPGWKSPRVLVTHVPKSFLPEQVLNQKKGKVITVIRNLKDTLTSYHYFIKGVFHRDSESSSLFEGYLQKYLYSDKVQFSPWFDHVHEYWAERYNRQYLVLKYEDMKADTRGAVIQIADFIGRPLSDEVIDKITDLVTVNSMKTRYNTAKEKRPSEPEEKKDEKKIGAPNIIRKGIIGDWKTVFTVAQNEKFDEYYRQKMEGSTLKLTFE